MKAILSNRVYLETDPELRDHIQNILSYKIPNFADPTNPVTMRTYSTIREGLMTLPSGRFDLIPPNFEIIDKRQLAPVDFPEFKFKLRESQQEIYDDITDSALINAKVSWGKTFMGAAIAGKFGQKTLVVVHTLVLMQQWFDEIKKVYGFEPGLIGGGKFNIKPPIVIGNTQSVTTRMSELCKTFGTVIMDEVHHAPSPTFSSIMDKSYARYKIGLSGTLKRKDGKHVIIPDYFSHKIYIPPKENSLTPTVHMIHSGLKFPDAKSMSWAEKVTVLQQSEHYRNLVAALIKSYRNEGHRVLMVSDRVDFLEVVAERTNSAIITGKTKDRETEFAKLLEENSSICGSLSIFKEGLSYNPLSCLILGCPINNEPMLEQLAGRIVRVCEDKLPPVIVDIVLDGYTTQNQAANRLNLYKQLGFKVIHQ